MTEHSHIFCLLFGNKCNSKSRNIHPAYKNFTPLFGFMPLPQFAGTIYLQGLF